MGQSIGAHIAACALLEQAVKETRGVRISALQGNLCTTRRVVYFIIF